ncbi:MAG TPA: CBS domain-containing protein [Pyrinomonadaceae bacterium]|jgi:CBS domain-containing protein
MRKREKQNANDRAGDSEAERKRESGMPGGGQGRKDKIEKSGVYPVSAAEGASQDAMVEGEASWGQGERGAAGYEDSGGSELIYLGEELGLIGGATEGESGAYKREDDLKGETNMKCKEIMTENPVCCLPGDTVDQAAQLMKDDNVGSIPVVADQKTKRLLGIITDRDLAVKVVAQARQISAVTVEEVMTRDPVTCHADDDFQKAVEAMEKHQVRRIPVVDDNNQIVGIIAQADVAVRAREPETTAEVVEEISKSATA